MRSLDPSERYHTATALPSAARSIWDSKASGRAARHLDAIVRAVELAPDGDRLAAGAHRDLGREALPAGLRAGGRDRLGRAEAAAGGSVGSLDPEHGAVESAPDRDGVAGRIYRHLGLGGVLPRVGDRLRGAEGPALGAEGRLD